MLILLTCFFVAAVTTLMLVRSAKLHAHRSGDRDFSKPQGLHLAVVPRIGGLAVVLGILAGVTALSRRAAAFDHHAALLLLGCAMPAFAAGFVQDLTESITPRGRLVATAISSVLAFVLLDAAVRRTAILPLDWVASSALGALLLTLLVVAGIAHAINIIDGLNGLASMCAVLMLSSICYVAFQVGDEWVAYLALGGVGAVLGFFVWNYPGGLIFLGDGGAYFLGFYVAELAILLLLRNPSVSPMFPLLACIYPIFETLFSMYRRSLLRRRPAHLPDGIHLHTLIYRRLLRWALGDVAGQRAAARRNSMASPLLWMLCMLAVAPATVFWDQTAVLLGFIALFGAVYTSLYWRIVRFNVPRWLRRAVNSARRAG